MKRKESHVSFASTFERTCAPAELRAPVVGLAALVVISASMGLMACGEPSPTAADATVGDTGPRSGDAGPGRGDAGPGRGDAGPGPADAGPGPVDASPGDSSTPPPMGDFCPAFADSGLLVTPTRVVSVSVSASDPTDHNLVAALQDAVDGDEILIEPGTYQVDRYAINITASVVIRGATGNRDDVVIRGPGYGTGGETLMVRAPDVAIADISLTNMRNHAISLKPGADRIIIYNVHLYDVGTQHIKGSAGPFRDGLIACSSIGYTEGGAQGDYINGIDIHRAIDWTIRDNYLYNIWGDGSGCEVDIDCGTYLPGGGPAILIWNGSSGNIVERNVIVESFMGIALGYGRTEHPGGIIRNNFIYRSRAGGDMGIHLDTARDTLVDHNTVYNVGDYPGDIELRDSRNITFRNNLITASIWDRRGNTYDAIGNVESLVIGDFQTPGRPAIRAGVAAHDCAGAVTIPGIDTDIAGNPRVAGAGPDCGAFEIPE